MKVEAEMKVEVEREKEMEDETRSVPNWVLPMVAFASDHFFTIFIVFLNGNFKIFNLNSRNMATFLMVSPNLTNNPP